MRRRHRSSGCAAQWYTGSRSGFLQHREQAPGRGDAACRRAGQGVQGTFGIGRRPHVAAAAWTLVDALRQIRERLDHVVRLDVGQAERADPGVSITQPAPSEWQRDRLGGGVLALAHTRHLACCPVGFWYKAIHQGGLADTGVAEEHRDLPGQQRSDGRERILTAGVDDGQVQVGELCSEGLGGARSDFVRHRMGFSPPAYAAIKVRSTNPVRGGGSASATTINS